VKEGGIGGGPLGTIPGRLCSPIAASGRPVDIAVSGAPETSGGGAGDGYGRRYRRPVSPRTPGRRIASPSPPPIGRRWMIGRRRGCMGTKRPRWPDLRCREARGGFSHSFQPFRNYFRFCKSTSGLTPTSQHTLYPYYTGF